VEEKKAEYVPTTSRSAGLSDMMVFWGGGGGGGSWEGGGALRPVCERRVMPSKKAAGLESPKRGGRSAKGGIFFSKTRGGVSDLGGQSRRGDLAEKRHRDELIDEEETRRESSHQPLSAQGGEGEGKAGLRGAPSHGSHDLAGKRRKQQPITRPISSPSFSRGGRE